jgi:hypothetical protein
MAMVSVANSSCDKSFFAYFLKLLRVAMARCRRKNRKAGEKPCHFSLSRSRDKKKYVIQCQQYTPQIHLSSHLANALKSTLVVKLRSEPPPDGKGSSMKTIVFLFYNVTHVARKRQDFKFYFIKCERLYVSERHIM